MMRRSIALVLSCVALSGCGELISFNAPGTPVHVTSVPPGAEASFGTSGQSCTTPCTLAAPNGTGTYNVSLKLNGYQPQNVPVRIALNEPGSMQSGDAGITLTTVITPDPVMAELEPLAPAGTPAAKKPPAARSKAKPATTTAATSAPPPASSPPPPAPPTLPSPLGTTSVATQPNVFR
jgi:PEGA domain